MMTLCLAAATAYHLPSSTPRVGVVTMQQQVAPGQEVLLAGHDLTQTFDGQRFPFKNIDVLLPRGAKQGLVGVNGAGKSSLLRVLAEEDAPESGNLEKSRGVRVAYVEQDPSLPAGSTAADFVYLADAPAMVALREFNAAVEASSSATDDDEALAARLAKASSTMDAAGAWDLETEMKRLCTVLSVGHLLERPADSLSGGERKRIAIAAALLQEPDVLLLDEPTNHLDIDAIRWLEAEIRSRRSLCVLVVTHDRAFLSEACDEILELHATALYRHKGDYGSFLRAKEERLHAEANAEAADRNKLRAELRWVQRQPKARSTKSKARLDAYDQLASRVASTAKPLGQVTIEAGMQRLGTAVLTCDALTVEVGGRTLFRDFSCEFARGARVGIVGPNGAGKSTFLKALMQQLPLAGGSVSCGETVVFGHYQQEGLKLPPGARVLALVQEAVARSPSGGQDAARDESAASALLRRFLFPPERWYEQHGQSGVLAGPRLATAGSSGCVRRLQAALRTREKRLGTSDPTERPCPWSHAPPKLTDFAALDHPAGTRRWSGSRAASGGGCSCCRCSRCSPTCSCSTSRPTISTSRRSRSSRTLRRPSRAW